MTLITLTVFAIVVIVSLSILGCCCVVILITRPKFGRLILDSCCYACGLCMFWTVTFIALIPLWLIVAGLIFLFYLTWVSGDTGFSIIWLILKTIFDGFLILFGIWNPVSTTWPLVMTVVNLFWKMFRLFIGGVLGLACTKLPFVDPDFHPQTHCPLLWSWIELMPLLAQIISDVVNFVISFLDIAGFSLLPGTCVDNLETCQNMCSDLGLPNGCFSTTNAINWIFSCSDTNNLASCNIWEFLVNNIDFFFLDWGIKPLIQWLADRIGLYPLIYDCPSHCWTSGDDYIGDLLFCLVSSQCTPVETVYQMITAIVKSNFSFVSFFFLGLLVHYVLSPIATLICMVFEAISPCLVAEICRAILPGWLDGGCPEEVCPCFKDDCVNGFGLDSVCTIIPSCTCISPYSNLILWIVNYALGRLWYGVDAL